MGCELSHVGTHMSILSLCDSNESQATIIGQEFNVVEVAHCTTTSNTSEQIMTYGWGVGYQIRPDVRRFKDQTGNIYLRENRYIFI